MTEDKEKDSLIEPLALQIYCSYLEKPVKIQQDIIYYSANSSDQDSFLSWEWISAEFICKCGLTHNVMLKDI